MPKVYVVQEQHKFDITPAAEFGEIKTILPPGDTPYSYEFTVARIHEVLKDIKSGDYLLLTGDPISIGLATAIANHYLMQNGLGFPTEVRLLKWLRRELRYLPITVDMGI